MILVKIFHGCKMISLKTVLQEKNEKNILVKNFDLLQNHFLQNWFVDKNYWENFFKVAKSFPANRFEDKHFWETFFKVATSFPRKQVWRQENFWEKFCGRTFLRTFVIVAKSFPKQYCKKKIWEKNVGRKFWLVVK